MSNRKIISIKKEAPPQLPAYHPVDTEASELPPEFNSSVAKLLSVLRFLERMLDSEKDERISIEFNLVEIKKLRKMTANLKRTMTVINAFQRVGHPDLMRETRCLAAFEAQSYRGLLGAGTVSNFQFNTSWPDIDELATRRPKPAPNQPSLESLDRKAESQMEREQAAILAELDQLMEEMSPADAVGMRQRAVSMIYEQFIETRCENGKCQDREGMRKAVAGFKRVQEYYHSYAPLLRHQRESVHLPQGGLSGLPNIDNSTDLSG